MGLDWIGTRFMLHARARGVSFERTAMIGRQGLHLEADELRDILERYGYESTADEVRDLLAASGGYAEPFFCRLGAKQVISLDFSAYEGATHLVDLNVPLPDASLEQSFTTVVEAGSLEHVFHFPQAISNCMKLVAPGGHFVGLLPTNNCCGHGFYQFSPELVFRLFVPDNGYTLEQIFVVEKASRAAWYEVRDPDEVRRRVELVNWRPTYVCFVARRVGTAAVLGKRPYQSDYVRLWNTAADNGGSGRTTRPASPSQGWKRLVPLVWKQFYWNTQRRLRDVLAPGSLLRRYDARVFQKHDIP